MKLILLCIVLPIFLPGLNAQNTFSLGTPEEDTGNAITQYDNRFFIIGTTRKTSTSATDYYMVEINEKGKVEHQFNFGGPHTDVGKDIVVKEDGIFIFGKTWDGGYWNNDMFLYKLRFDGTLLWSKFYGSNGNDFGHKFSETKDGGFVMIGHKRSDGNLGDVYIVKTDNKGEQIWENQFGGRYIDHGFDVIENEQGEFIIVGTLGGFYNPSTFDFLNHDADIFIIKTNAQGEKIWEKTYGGSSHEWAKKIIAAPGGGYYICGSTQSKGAGSFDMFLMKMDEDGNELWMKTYGGANFEYGESVQLNVENNLYLLGSSASFSENKKPDHFLVKTDLNGNVIWEKTFGGEGSDYSASLVCLADSGCAFTGWTNRGTAGKKDIILYKISKIGRPFAISDSVLIDDNTIVNVYPNPAVNFVKIEVIANKESSYLFSLFDVNGRTVTQKQIRSNSINRVPFKERSGIYFYKVENVDNTTYVGKLIIQN